MSLFCVRGLIDFELMKYEKYIFFHGVKKGHQSKNKWFGDTGSHFLQMTPEKCVLFPLFAIYF